MKKLFAFLLLFSCSLSAQKMRIGFVNGDSLLHTMPDYAAVKSSTVASQGMQDTITGMEDEMVRKQRELDSLRPRLSPLMIQLRTLQLQQMNENKQAYIASRGEMASNNTNKLLPYEQALRIAVENARVKNKCDTVLLENNVPANSDKAEFVNLNGDVGKEIASSKSLHAQPKRIGYLNSDSLYKQMPGYLENRLEKNKEIVLLNQQLAVKDKEIDAKQRENDSLYGKRSQLMRDRGKAEEDRLNKERAEMATNGNKAIERNDSIRNRANIQKMEQATQKLCVSDSCFYIYDKATAQQLYKDQPVVMVNMNDKVAKELGVYGLPPLEEPPPIDINNTPPPPPPQKSKIE